MIRLLGISALCFVTISSLAQLKDIEFMVGPNQAMLRSNQVNPVSQAKSNYHARTGFTAGFGSAYYFTDRLSLGVRLLYQRAVVRGDFPFSESVYRGNLELTTVFDQLSLPVVARYTIGNKIKFSGELGGFVNCFLNETAKDYYVYDRLTPQFAKGSEQYSRFDTGVSVGVSAQVPITGTVSIRLSAFDNYGLVNISPLQLYSRTDYLRSNSLNLLAGVVYRL